MVCLYANMFFFPCVLSGADNTNSETNLRKMLGILLESDTVNRDRDVYHRV